MPITKSAKKAYRQSLRRRARNLLWKNKVRKLIKDFQKQVAAKNWEKAKELLPQTYKVIDKAAKVGILKKNTAGRRKSRLARLLLGHLK